jgi:hypothetical protein
MPAPARRTSAAATAAILRPQPVDLLGCDGAASHQGRALLDVDPPLLVALAPALSQVGVGRGRLAQRENHSGGALVDARDEPGGSARPLAPGPGPQHGELRSLIQGYRRDVDGRPQQIALGPETGIHRLDGNPAARATSRIPVAAQPRSPNSRAAAEATIDRVSAACCSRRGDR